MVDERIAISGYKSFFIGSLCPDLSSSKDGTKVMTHFTRYPDGKKGADWNAFLRNMVRKRKVKSEYLIFTNFWA